MSLLVWTDNRCQIHDSTQTKTRNTHCNVKLIFTPIFFLSQLILLDDGAKIRGYLTQSIWMDQLHIKNWTNNRSQKIKSIPAWYRIVCNCATGATQELLIRPLLPEAQRLFIVHCTLTVTHEANLIFSAPSRPCTFVIPQIYTVMPQNMATSIKLAWNCAGRLFSLCVSAARRRIRANFCLMKFWSAHLSINIASEL